MAVTRPRHALLAGLSISILTLVGPLGAAPAAAAEPREPAPRPADQPAGIRAFMHALAFVESSGFYSARNATSGAIGRYQVLPSNWPAWAARYVGDRGARRTSLMQERVARGRLTDLHRQFGRWDLVAYWWLTGRDGRHSTPWSASATRYVGRVMAGFRVIRRVLASRPDRIQERSSRIRYSGTWRTARSGAYAGGGARYSTATGASVSVTFTGRAVSWIGPVGPTRGRAAVYVDGRYLRSLNLYATRFHARRVLLEAAWPVRGVHRLTIRVIATPVRHVVSLDELLLRP
jgi:hypothetical protein